MNLQMNALAIAYGVSAGAMLLALLFMRAEPRAYWRWPAYSAMAMVLGIVTLYFLRKHVVPLEWSRAHASAMYYGALAIYALAGVAMGLLLGRLTRRKTPGST